MSRTSFPSDGLVRFVFGLTIFLSAFLLFLVQPLISKIILPWFGGSTGVWATCMVFFQVMLCVGYAYAHFIQRLPLKTQRWCHWGLLGVGLFCLPVMPGEGWKPVDGNFPTLRILTLLLLKTGLPYLALSATGPLLQSWYARLFPDSRTYRLYALSNVASLVSLLLFPLWFERTMTSWVLSLVWSIAFVVFVLGCGFVAFCVSQSRFASLPVDRLSEESGDSVASSAPNFLNYLSWLILPAFASFLLVAGTSHLCQDIASTPFLWILPLCLYLLSFILCFDAPHWYVRRVYVVLGLIGLYGVCAMHGLSDSETLAEGYLVHGSLPMLAPIWDGLNWYTPTAPPLKESAAWFRNQVLPGKFHVDLIGQIALHCLALFAVFMICHGELTKRKPPAKYLTAFYLMISIGGAIGSASVSFLAPLLFKGIWEWWFGLTLCVVFLCLLLFQWRPDNDAGEAFTFRYFLFVLPALVILGTTLFQNSSFPLSMAVLIEKGGAASEAVLDDGTGELSEDQALTVKARRLSKPLAYGLLIVLCFVSVVGLAAVLMKTSKGRWYRWSVVNAAAFGIVVFYARDALMFSVPNLFEESSVVSDLTNDDNVVWRGRNFYGSLTIEESSNVRTLQHGRIVHGTQQLDGPKRSQPSTYYAVPDSGVSLAMEHVSQRPTIHLGAVGLGTGTLASFAAPNWSYRSTLAINPEWGPKYRFTVYEINPLVVELSEAEKPWFCYLADARERGAEVNIVLGDARLMMERQEPQNFDVLAIDAFSSDAIPVHLLTDEAMTIYRRHLRDDGILAIHISNRYLDLEPVCKALARKHRYDVRVVEGEGEDAYSSTWVLLTRDVSLTTQLDETAESSRGISQKAAVNWNDAFSSLYEVLIDSDFDEAVLSISGSKWYRELKTKQPYLEIEFVPRWWKDEWTYCRTIDPADPKYLSQEIRFRDWKLQAKENGGWVDVE